MMMALFLPEMGGEEDGEERERLKEGGEEGEEG